MRVLDTHIGRFVEIDPDETAYAILSHTWDHEGEQTYQDVLRIQSSIAYHIETVLAWACIYAWCGSLGFLSFLLTGVHHTTHFIRRIVHPPYSTTPFPQVMTRSGIDYWLREGPGRWARALEAKVLRIRCWNSINFSYRLSSKVRRDCAIARADGYRYIWIDSCCINKESSSELSEAINSMYRCYGLATRCYAFLADVPDLEEEDIEREGSSFRNSRWFTRGWTLQELIVPRGVVFLSNRWNVLGSKIFLAHLVESITCIEVDVLIHFMPLYRVSVATRMSWARRRGWRTGRTRCSGSLG